MMEWRTILHSGANLKFPQKGAPSTAPTDTAFSAQQRLASSELEGQFKERAIAMLANSNAKKGEEDCEAEHAAAIHNHVMVRCSVCLLTLRFLLSFVQGRLGSGELDGHLRHAAEHSFFERF
jgi:hypothetical protein